MNEDLPKAAEIVVVGAGILGLTTALRLAEAGRDVLVIDRAEPFCEGSGVNAGTLALQNKPNELLLFYRESLDEWRRLRDELDDDVGHVRRGGLRVAGTEADMDALRASAAEQAALGIETQWLEGNEMRARAPWLGPGIRAATYCAEDGFASPLLAGRALVRALRTNGGRFVANARLIGSEERADGFELETSKGHVRCGVVVLATGAWTERATALFGLDIPVRIHVNMLSVTERMAQFMDNMVVTHIAGRFTLKQFPNGSCVLGGGFKGRGNIDTGAKELDFEQLIANLRFQCEVVPHLMTANLLRSWAGFTGVLDDGLPLLGPWPENPNLIFAFTTGAGFTLGPAAGRAVAEIITAGAVPERLARYGPGRLSHQFEQDG